MATTTKADITKALNKLDLAKQAIIDEVYVLADQVAEVGIQAARAKLDRSVTKTGKRRMAASPPIGNSAGRNKTGLMIASLRNLGIDATDTNIRAKIGWEENSYFKFQERGTDRIPAANSLQTARRAMQNEIPRLIRNMRQRIRRKGL